MKMTRIQHKEVSRLAVMQHEIHGFDTGFVTETCEKRGYEWDKEDIDAMCDLMDNAEIEVFFHD